MKCYEGIDLVLASGYMDSKQYGDGFLYEEYSYVNVCDVEFMKAS